MYRTVFTVEGRGTFPLDMLRYDACHPSSSSDASTITDNLREHPRAPQRISLTSLRPRKLNALPTVGRWHSFGWTVLESVTTKLA